MTDSKTFFLKIPDFKGFCFLFRFIAARGMKRKIIFHSGPTNSGKTHQALDRFEKSDTGIYGGPLRMLAAEVYQRTNQNVTILPSFSCMLVEC